MVVRKVAGAVRAGMWAVAVAALAPSVAAANDDARTGRITYFEPLRALPAAPSSAQRKAGGSSMQQLRFDAFGRRFDISLGSNDRLMMSKPAHSQLELYSGAIDGIAGSWVRLATNGAVVHGMMWDGTQLYAIEPTAEVWTCVVNAKGKAVVDGQTLAAEETAGPFNSRSFTAAFGNGSVRILVDGKTVQTPSTPNPMGITVDAQGRVHELPEGERPSCE